MTTTGINRRVTLLASLGLVSAGPTTAATLPSTDAMTSALAKALAEGRPLLVLVSLEGCSFCKMVRDNYLAPMHARDGLAVVQVDMRSSAEIKDFKGVAFTHDALIRSWGVKVAPTVLFFGKGGTEVAERLVGGYIPDFYGAYLDERLRTATKAVGP